MRRLCVQRTGKSHAYLSQVSLRPSRIPLEEVQARLRHLQQLPARHVEAARPHAQPGPRLGPRVRGQALDNAPQLLHLGLHCPEGAPMMERRGSLTVA